MAICSPTMRLNSVLLPTFGRPTMTTVGRARRIVVVDARSPGILAWPASSACAQRDAVGRHDLDRAGQRVDRGAVEEAALAEADVGQAGSGASIGSRGQDAGEVFADHQPGDGGVAAEELVAHRDRRERRSRPRSATSGRSTLAPNSPVRMPIGRRRRGAAARAVAWRATHSRACRCRRPGCAARGTRPRARRRPMRRSRSADRPGRRPRR